MEVPADRCRIGPLLLVVAPLAGYCAEDNRAAAGGADLSLDASVQRRFAGCWSRKPSRDVGKEVPLDCDASA